MSHFSCVVLVPRELENYPAIEAHIEKSLALYDENLEVPPYDCVCKSSEQGGDDPECWCEGVGVLTYNPKSQWDWWVVGGRWDGWLQGDHRPGFNFGAEHHEVANNIIDAETLKKLVHQGDKRLPFAAVDLGGGWNQRGEMGWFGTSSDEKGEGEWREQFVEMLDKAGQCWAVGCDLHI
ncbi:MAG: hypothetical protein V3W41_14660 [Planctomycetota bacterium]